MSDHDPALIEKAARAICDASNRGPDDTFEYPYTPAWRDYEDHARAVLNAVADDLRDHCHLDLLARAEQAEAEASNLQADYDRRGERLWRLAAKVGLVPHESDNDAIAEFVVTLQLDIAEAALSRVLADVEEEVGAWEAEAHQSCPPTHDGCPDCIGRDFAARLRARLTKHRQPAEDRPHGANGGDVGTGATEDANGAQGGTEGFEGDA